MRKENNTPHMGMIVALGVLIAAIWMLAIYDTIQDAHEEKYDVSVRPGAVSYGTHSSATIPMVSSPMHSTSAPMISGSAVRSYAHYGHASMPSSAVGSGFKMHTTSSATVHTVGSGGGGGSIGAANGSSSSRGITYGGASVSMPTFAFVTPNYAMQASESSRNAIGPRRIHANGDGEYDGEYNSGTGEWWNEDDQEWVTDPFNGCVRYHDGHMERYKDGDWIVVDNQGDPSNTPVGATPWLLMLLLAMGYGIVKVIRKKQNAIQ